MRFYFSVETGPFAACSMREATARGFAADVNPGLAAFMADSQVPWGVQALSGMVSEPAWKSKPSWYLVSTEDKMIPPDAQRAMSKRAGSKVVEVKGSHAIYVSQAANLDRSRERNPSCGGRIGGAGAPGGGFLISISTDSPLSGANAAT
jgi:alpha/beta hydrolase family protein